MLSKPISLSLSSLHSNVFRSSLPFLFSLTLFVNAKAKAQQIRRARKSGKFTESQIEGIQTTHATGELNSVTEWGVEQVIGRMRTAAVRRSISWHGSVVCKDAGILFCLKQIVACILQKLIFCHEQPWIDIGFECLVFADDRL